ncbi:hypothetical protein [Bacillus sp. 1P06AnD]|uniref:hypothetical protein n=1 Tax=Bacillus sp. 1P06AnD TaxID=3132208 RepID=UPI0039A04BC2
MARKNNQQKINEIEEQIKQLLEKKKQMEQNLQLSIGKKIITSWNCTDEQILLSVIEELTDEAIIRIKNKTPLSS